MGMCSSSESTFMATAKLILQDGRLLEFSYPVKASYVLQKDPTCFICDSDEMEFDEVASAICDDEELQPGHLYFALPLTVLKRPLQLEEMAALAVKASSALMKGGRRKCGCHRKRLSSVGMLGTEMGVKPSGRVADCEDGGESGGLRRGRGGRCAAGGGGGGRGGGGRRSFEAKLRTIPE